MGEHETWFHLLPGVRSIEAYLTDQFGPGVVFSTPTTSITHILMALFVLLICVALGLSYRSQVKKAGENAVIPARKFGVRAAVDWLANYLLDMMSGVMGREAAIKFLPLVGGLGCFILISNFSGLLPGFSPSTSVLETTFAAAIVVFLATHFYGFKRHGFIGYIKEMMGPIWWLGPLFLAIELVSHVARPLSLGLRLMGNMVGDHMVLAVFLSLIPILIPIPIILLGMIVCIVQTLVFCLLSTVYIALAIEEE